MGRFDIDADAVKSLGPETPPDAEMGEDLRQKLEAARKGMEYHRLEIQSHTLQYEQLERISQACVVALEVLDPQPDPDGARVHERSAGPISVR